MKKKKHGGKRSGAGRKPLADKRMNINIFPLSSRVLTLGKEKVKVIAIEAIENEFKNTMKIV